jgi:anti-sigma factor RsiW
VTGDQFSEVDFDLLADYVGGALAGTPDQATVARRVADDPAWRAAYDELSDAMATVGSQLAALGARPEPMPVEVAARVDAALSEAPPPLAVLPGGGSEARPARRRPRWTAPIAVAAAIVVFAGIGTGFWMNRTQSSNDSQVASSAGSAADRSAPVLAPSAALPPADDIHSSGMDYDAATLGKEVPRPFSATRGESANAPDAGPSAGKTLAGPLTRLRSSADLEACLAAITAANGVGPLTVESVDYARYAGKPALIVVFTAANGRFAWASGADCGAPGVGADRLNAVPVG